MRYLMVHATPYDGPHPWKRWDVTRILGLKYPEKFRFLIGATSDDDVRIYPGVEAAYEARERNPRAEIPGLEEFRRSHRITVSESRRMIAVSRRLIDVSRGRLPLMEQRFFRQRTPDDMPAQKRPKMPRNEAQAELVFAIALHRELSTLRGGDAGGNLRDGDLLRVKGFGWSFVVCELRVLPLRQTFPRRLWSKIEE